MGSPILKRAQGSIFTSLTTRKLAPSPIFFFFERAANGRQHSALMKALFFFFKRRCIFAMFTDTRSRFLKTHALNNMLCLSSSWVFSMIFVVSHVHVLNSKKGSKPWKRTHFRDPYLGASLLQIVCQTLLRTRADASGRLGSIGVVREARGVATRWLRPAQKARDRCGRSARLGSYSTAERHPVCCR